MIKRLIVLCLVIFLLAEISALRINEVEMNPVEGSSGKEWVELYNEDKEEINITNWEIWEGVSGTSGPKKIKNFSEEIVLKEGEFYIIEFSNKLNNGGDFVILYDSSHNKIDETPTLDEAESSGQTYQLCDGEWKFMASTKEQENNCTIIPEEEEEPNEETEQTPENQSEEENNETTSPEEEDEEESSEQEEEENYFLQTNSADKNTTLETINLNADSASKGIKSEEDKEILKRNLAIGGVITFCLMFGALFLLRLRKGKNEFR